MMFSNKAVTSRRRSLATRAAALVGAVVLGLVAACGGGTSQYEAFVPGRLLVFGDEDSTLTQTGRTYSVNGLDTNGVVDCTARRIWVQDLASQFGFTFAECNPNSVFQPQARMLAFAGAKVADVATQVEAQVAAGGFRDRDLASVLAGTNDLIELYAQFPSRSEASLVTEAGQRGARLAQAVNRLVALGVKVIVADLPDLGLTPFATAENALAFNTARSTLLSNMTSAFNEQLGVRVVLDGRFVGLVQTQLRFQTINRSPSSFGIVDISSAVCTVALPDCTNSTLVAGADPAQYLWSDDRRMAPGAHAQLAQLAIDRAVNNPF